MPVSYSKEQKQASKETGQPLVTIDVRGLSFQGPTTQEEGEALTQYLLDFLKRRRTPKPDGPKGAT